MEVNEGLTLLPEIWFEVLKYLPIKDLFTMSLVSTDMNELCKRPTLWRNAKIKKLKFRRGNILDYFKIGRYRKVKRLDFSRIPLKDEMVQLVLEKSISTDLRELDLQGVNLSEVSAELLATALYPLEKVDLTFTKISSEQAEYLFAYFENNPPVRMREASFKAINLSNVNPSIFASNISRLEKVNLSFTELTPDQLTHLFDTLVTQNDVNLNNIEFFSVDLSGTSPRLLGKALVTMEVVSLSNTELRFEHIQSFFEEIVKSIYLKELNLDFSELFYVSSELFANSLSRLEKVSLACTVMDIEQLELLLENISKQSKIRELDLLDTDMTGIDAKLTGEAVNKLEKINLSGCKLTGEQLNFIVEEYDFMTLKDLNLDYVDLCKVDEESLSALAMKLEKISLKKSNLTAHQLNAFLSRLQNIDEDSRLKEVNLHGNNCSEVVSDYFAQSIKRLESIDLSHTNIPVEAIAEILYSLSCDMKNTLKYLSLVGNNLENLNSEIIVAALKKLERMDLSNTNLSPEQATTVLDAVGPPLMELGLFNIKLDMVNQEIVERAKDLAFINYRQKN